jgi:hypothetical protein
MIPLDEEHYYLLTMKRFHRPSSTAAAGVSKIGFFYLSAFHFPFWLPGCQ